MTKVNIDLGVDTSFGVSASASVTAGAEQTTTVGFDSKTKFLFQSGWNLSAFSASCSYSMKEWLITGTLYRSTGTFAKYATKSIDIGCQSFFGGAGTVDIASKDNLQFLAGIAIRARVSQSQSATELAGDKCGALLLTSVGDCKIEKCDAINVKVDEAKCVAISQSNGVSIYGEKVNLLPSDGVQIFNNAVTIDDTSVNWFKKSLIAKPDNVDMLNVSFKNGHVSIPDQADIDV